jgi:hypothetical protein
MEGVRMKLYFVGLSVVVLVSSIALGENAELWTCQNTCYFYPANTTPQFDPGAYPLYGAQDDHIVQGEEITFCGENPQEVKASAVNECQRLHPSSEGNKVGALIELFPATFDILCSGTGQACEIKGVRKADYECVANCVSSSDNSKWYPSRFSYCAMNNREALAMGTKFYNQTGGVCVNDYSLESPDSYDYVAVPLLDRCQSTGKECS